MAALTGQYTEIPGGSSQDSSQNAEGSKNITNIIYAAIGFVVLIIIYFVFFSAGGQGSNELSLGDFETPSSEDNLAANTAKNTTTAKSETEDKCISPKNCLNSPTVCKCNPGEYCSSESKSCVKPVCGNGRCEPGEYVDTCCDDCGCVDDGCQVCNLSFHVCDTSESKVSDEQAIEAVESYLQDKGIVSEEISVGSTVCFDSRILKYVLVTRSGSEILEEFSVSESMAVFPSPRI